jgi:AcrR family transcriptional regulator
VSSETPARVSRTQKERRTQTRRALLDATVECLLELGFASTTTLEVQRRAGLSRGALLHHFPSKAELLVAAVSHLVEMRGREIKERSARLPAGGARVDAVIDLLWESFSGPLFTVALELRAAARTDEELRRALAPAEIEIRDRICAQSRRLFGARIAGRPGFEPALDMTLQLMIGTATTASLHREPARARELIDQWKAAFPALLTLPTTPAPATFQENG